MRIEIGPYVKAEELVPGTIYTQHDQGWWDQALTGTSMGIFIYIRTDYPIPEAWKDHGAYLITVHPDENGVEPSTEAHIVDTEPEGEDEPDESLPDSTDPESTEDSPVQVGPKKK